MVKELYLCPSLNVQYSSVCIVTGIQFRVEEIDHFFLIKKFINLLSIKIVYTENIVKLYFSFFACIILIFQGKDLYLLEIDTSVLYFEVHFILQFEDLKGSGDPEYLCNGHLIHPLFCFRFRPLQ